MDAETLVSEPERMEEGSEPEEDQGDEEEDFTVEVGTTYSCKRQDGTYHDAEVVKSRMNKRAGREEFYVHYIGLPCRQNEWVDKPRLVLVNPVKEAEEKIDDDEEANETAANETAANETAANETAANETAANETAANETVQEKSENGDASENQKSDEEPLAKKIKVEVHDPPANSSLVAPEEFAEELTCPLCIELFKDPVVVECGHNFCRSCLDEAWEGQESFTCPDCKEVITDRKYMSNRALANLVKKSAHPVKSVVKEKPRLPEKCLVHDERLKLFCKDDGDLGCIICRESLKHTNHNFLPILDAVGVYRSELTSIVSPLEDALKMAEQMAKQQNEKIENHRTNMEECQEHIKSEFAKLHQLLTEREDKLLQKLHEEGSSLLTEMEANIAKMQENISSIKESISLASEKLGNTDAVAFLTDIKSFIKKCNEQQKEALSSGNTLIDKELSKDTYKAPIKSSICDEEMAPAPPKPKEIWIIGNYWVTKTAQLARKCGDGKNLGLEEKEFVVRWMDKYSMQWHSLLPDIKRNAAIQGDPSIVFIHLGSSDLQQEQLKRFIFDVKGDLSRLKLFYPNTTFIWSAILPRSDWMKTYMELQREKFNGQISSFAEKLGMQVCSLSDLSEMFLSKWREKRSYIGKEIAEAFTKCLKESLETAIVKMKKD